MTDYHQQADWTTVNDHQSPIDIDTANTVVINQYLPFTMNNKHHLKLDRDDGTTIQVTGTGHASIFNRPFHFVQLHFHWTSEHLIDGETTPLEIHMVYQSSIGQLCVVSLMVKHGPADETLQEIIDNFKPDEDIPVEFLIKNWVHEKSYGFHYLGSLTTPPLTEGVEWVVITNPLVTASVDQLAWFKKHFASNDRTVQELNGRVVEWYQE
ncbi:hypothetical protein AYR62_11840 [Secundilactobacillus paracollinoides]|uniref:carbonic anhydrase n=1 Tax=Secundilactobacillus paracollinoides TaxID=240427 RepID=A0A1B2IXI0_9LACO|nr:carbonic anhydrase family protein [Secundilactobacillus paracollinoides]ANZ60935.1 hypothetical protein AYR61_05990 [Secundilactobacillus paracollinoides]ANZ64699.1 hypothetical protein AYR62_11840 [Secundilactobacillus paracollinoides]ANZ66794.1 hypothetical protein AYR63_06360 [Secundilactobacillus paracollinoides]KRL80700.1 carbonate dehydratase, eukaryotic-type [Secundilactobacillus paracollinoides DSM 15502 = JCM 11969]